MHCASVALGYNVAKDSLFSGKSVIHHTMEFLLQKEGKGEEEREQGVEEKDEEERGEEEKGKSKQ